MIFNVASFVCFFVCSGLMIYSLADTGIDDAYGKFMNNLLTVMYGLLTVAYGLTLFDLIRSMK